MCIRDSRGAMRAVAEGRDARRLPRAIAVEGPGAADERGVRSGDAAALWRRRRQHPAQCAPPGRARPGPQRHRCRLHAETVRAVHRQGRCEIARCRMPAHAALHTALHQLQWLGTLSATRSRQDHSMIVAEHLRKTFPGKDKRAPVVAVDDVGFIARDGEITGLLGPNGAGKTTTLRMLYTLMRPESGRCLLYTSDAADER